MTEQGEPRVARSDDPQSLMNALRMIDAIAVDDRERLQVVLREIADSKALFVTMMALASLTMELMRARPDWEAWLSDLMIGTEIELISDTPPPDDGEVSNV